MAESREEPKRSECDGSVLCKLNCKREKADTAFLGYIDAHTRYNWYKQQLILTKDKCHALRSQCWELKKEMLRFEYQYHALEYECHLLLKRLKHE